MTEQLAADAADQPGFLQELCQRVAASAEHCLKPHRFAVRLDPPDQATSLTDHSLEGWDDLSLRLEARTGEGVRCPALDLALEMYRSGVDVHLMLSLHEDVQAPLLWYGSHAVWMDGISGERCPPPAQGAALEGLCRRLRAQLLPP